MKEETKTTLRMEKEIHKRIKRFCVDEEISFQDFAVNSMLYCLEKNILPNKGK